MEQLEVDSKITVNNKEYIIVDILQENDRNYLLCCTIKGKKEAEIFEYKNKNGKMMVRSEKDLEIINKFASKIIK